jgi:hypothetical protein
MFKMMIVGNHILLVFQNIMDNVEGQTGPYHQMGVIIENDENEEINSDVEDTTEALEKIPETVISPQMNTEVEVSCGLCMR